MGVGERRLPQRRRHVDHLVDGLDRLSRAASARCPARRDSPARRPRPLPGRKLHRGSEARAEARRHPGWGRSLSTAGRAAVVTAAEDNAAGGPCSRQQGRGSSLRSARRRRSAWPCSAWPRSAALAPSSRDHEAEPEDQAPASPSNRCRRRPLLQPASPPPRWPTLSGDRLATVLERAGPEAVGGDALLGPAGAGAVDGGAGDPFASQISLVRVEVLAAVETQVSPAPSIGWRGSGSARRRRWLGCQNCPGGQYMPPQGSGRAQLPLTQQRAGR